jgi:hypothetical protein
MRDSMEKELYDVLILNGIKYLPHYQNSAVFVGPGYKEGGVAYSRAYLEQYGATNAREFLWVRSEYGKVKNVL